MNTNETTKYPKKSNHLSIQTYLHNDSRHYGGCFFDFCEIIIIFVG